MLEPLTNEKELNPALESKAPPKEVSFAEKIEYIHTDAIENESDKESQVSIEDVTQDDEIPFGLVDDSKNSASEKRLIDHVNIVIDSFREFNKTKRYPVKETQLAMLAVAESIVESFHAFSVLPVDIKIKFALASNVFLGDKMSFLNLKIMMNALLKNRSLVDFVIKGDADFSKFIQTNPARFSSEFFKRKAITSAVLGIPTGAIGYSLYEAGFLTAGITLGIGAIGGFVAVGSVLAAYEVFNQLNKPNAPRP